MIKRADPIDSLTGCAQCGDGVSDQVVAGQGGQRRVKLRDDDERRRLGRGRDLTGSSCFVNRERRRAVTPPPPPLGRNQRGER